MRTLPEATVSPWPAPGMRPGCRLGGTETGDAHSPHCVSTGLPCVAPGCPTHQLPAHNRPVFWAMGAWLTLLCPLLLRPLVPRSGDHRQAAPSQHGQCHCWGSGAGSSPPSSWSSAGQWQSLLEPAPMSGGPRPGYSAEARLQDWQSLGGAEPLTGRPAPPGCRSSQTHYWLCPFIRGDTGSLILRASVSSLRKLHHKLAVVMQALTPALCRLRQEGFKFKHLAVT